MRQKRRLPQARLGLHEEKAAVVVVQELIKPLQEPTATFEPVEPHPLEHRPRGEIVPGQFRIVTELGIRLSSRRDAPKEFAPRRQPLAASQEGDSIILRFEAKERCLFRASLNSGASWDLP